MTGYIYAGILIITSGTTDITMTFSYHIISTKSDINNLKIYKIMLCLYDQRKLIFIT